MVKDIKYKVLLSSNEFLFNATLAKTFFSKLLGIMFKRQIPSCAIIFEDSFWMHSFFCFLTFHIVFLDKNFNVIKTFYNVKPNRILPPVLKSKYVIEFFDENIKFKENDKIILEKI